MNKIGIFGLGNMGEAVLKTLLKSGTKKTQILSSEVKPERAEYIAKTYNVKISKQPEEVTKQSKYMVIAVKPQDAKDLLRDIAPIITENHVIVSLMAGITTSNILSIIGKPVKVVRTMPNISVKVGEGAIGITFNSMVEQSECEEIKRILLPLGKVIEVGEELMDAVTALGGSGPAFFLLFLEGMIDAGVKTGLPREKAKILSIQVAKGVISMLEEEGVHPVLMKEMVTSPGGTTIAGLTILEEKGFKGSIIKAVEEARKRAKELSL